jgi:hypothetical protein
VWKYTFGIFSNQRVSLYFIQSVNAQSSKDRIDKIDNCQVGVFATLGRGNHSLPFDCPRVDRRQKNGAIRQRFLNTKEHIKTKHELSLEMIFSARKAVVPGYHKFTVDYSLTDDCCILVA